MFKNPLKNLDMDLQKKYLWYLFYYGDFTFAIFLKIKQSVKFKYILKLCESNF